VITLDAGVGGQVRRIDDPDGRARRRAQTDAGHAAAARKAGAQIGEGGDVIEHVWLTALRFFKCVRYVTGYLTWSVSIIEFGGQMGQTHLSCGQ